MGRFRVIDDSDFDIRKNRSILNDLVKKRNIRHATLKKHSTLLANILIVIALIEALCAEDFVRLGAVAEEKHLSYKAAASHVIDLHVAKENSYFFLNCAAMMVDSKVAIVSSLPESRLLHLALVGEKWNSIKTEQIPVLGNLNVAL